MTEHENRKDYRADFCRQGNFPKRTSIFKRIPKTQDFVSLAIDHDEEPAGALAREASASTGMQASLID